MLALFKKYFGIFKYIVAGGSAACVNLGTLYLLTEYGKLHYLQSAVLSFICAFFVSFLLQKFWTFRDVRKEVIHWQMMGFLGSSLVNLFLNTTIIFILVEYLHVWYLIAAFIAGVLLAIASFFVYRHVIFVEHKEGSKIHRALTFFRKNLFEIAAAAVFVLAIFLATYHLTESPPTWLDEGIITQTALNVLAQGPHAALQTAPNTFVSAGYVSTSYPATYPVALGLALLGQGLLQARAVMALLILSLLAAAYFFMRKEASRSMALMSLALVATFAPLYGNGKNVLGEIPGLLYLFGFLFFVRKIESKETGAWDYLAAGALLGLAVATKPIFLLLLPPVALVYLLSFRLFSLKHTAAALLGLAAAIGWWAFSQFGGESISYILGVYANPHHNDFLQSLSHNALSFVTQVQPLYALLLLIIWLASIGLRVRLRRQVSRAEYIAAGFSVLVYLAFLRGAEYYRYFFLGEVLALAYLPLSLHALWPKRVPPWVLWALIALLASFQLYQCLFDSWVAEHYSSTRSRDLAALVSNLRGSVLLYDAPEAAIFLPTRSYYQYLNLVEVIRIGAENLPKLSNGEFNDVVILQAEEGSADLSRYRLIEHIDRYGLWEKK